MIPAHLREASAEFGEFNDCSVKALALVSGESYADAHYALHLEGRKNRDGAYPQQQYRALRWFGLGVFFREDLEHYVRTPISAARYMPRKGRFLIHTTGHVLAFVDGEVLDWTAGRRHRVRRIVEVLPEERVREREERLGPEWHVRAAFLK